MTGLSSSAERAVQAEGYGALMANQSPRSNPYPWSDPRCAAWIAGYAQARTDRAKRMTRTTPDAMDGIEPPDADQP